MTRLLEALIGLPLVLDLTDQHVTTGATLDHTVRAALGCDDTDPVVVRQSTLTTADGAAVSLNRVTIMATDHELTTLLTDDRLPIGHSLAAARRHLARTVLGAGVARWPTPGGQEGLPCAYKESVLSDSGSRAVAHLHERFNPAYAPLGSTR
ncbi:hypothetical protein [Nocardia sp. NBC_00416]|uniref:hypothetical protein n=1 Tax=Nocardia sp. NBC_00416 TaxID=2975991 RepID=UPI002E1E9547